ncbi:hypothetical protein F53441_8026 [Fusarium austroafricanum]|uniref:DOMON domain-containing protein n=1 Tax=Fusarium austroafricanum TaxID=2364996 RepID=A0A8H4P562_9HYPO|nr:hypothetical protein F53441_8026 [Fusarium austroafricanum]
MKSLSSIAITAALALFAGQTSASPTSYCNGKSNKVCYTWAVPSSTASSNSGNIYIRIQAPVEYQWVGLGTGDQMSGSTMFVIYQDGHGGVTLSTRLGHGHEMPMHNRMRSMQLLKGSGVHNNTMVANIACGDLGNMHYKQSNHWISAWKSGKALNTTDIDADITEHDEHNSFTVDFSKAVVTSGGNPLGHMSTDPPSDAETGGGGGDDRVATIHGIVMSVVFLLGYPLGSLLMPLLSKWFIHASWQIVVFIGMWIGFALGKIAADRENYWFTQPHVIIGTVVCGLMIVQPILGWLHHRNYLKYQRRTGISYGHLWYGRTLMIAGIVNGGLGLSLAGAPLGWIIAYSVIGLVTSLLYTAGAVRKTVIVLIFAATVHNVINMAILPIATAVVAVVLLIKHLFLDPLIFSPLRHVPGPKSFAFTKWRLAYEDWKGTRTRTIFQLHQKYGPVVRIGPNEVSFNSLSALRTIYGPGSRFGRTSFYRMFDVYGEQNLFTLHSPKAHGERKKLLSHAYSKSVVMKQPTAKMVERRARQYLDLIEAQPEMISEIFSTLHYYSLDNITAFVYGEYGQTAAIRGSAFHRALISDILHPSRRRLSWSIVHLKSLTQWLYRQSGLMGQLVQPVLPMQQPTTYTGIRGHALQAFRSFKAEAEVAKPPEPKDDHMPIIQSLWQYHESQMPGGLNDMQMASECADHFLAGIDTTSDSLMFLIWALSLPGNEKFQEKLREEVMTISGDGLNQWGNPRAEASDRCTYLNAVIKETIRLYAPLPSTEPRSVETDSVIDGYTIPGNTVVGMSPWVMHRNADVFKDPLVFNPDRWLGPDAAELNRWFWGFSSGGRMCIGMHLAMVEMTVLAATMYRQFRTTIAPGFEDTTPAITARVETFYDERFPKVQESTCLIKFTKLKS